jgi:hypothetical protein
MFVIPVILSVTRRCDSWSRRSELDPGHVGHIDYNILRRIYTISNEELTAMRVGIEVRRKLRVS